MTPGEAALSMGAEDRGEAADGSGSLAPAVMEALGVQLGPIVRALKQKADAGEAPPMMRDAIGGN